MSAPVTILPQSVRAVVLPPAIALPVAQRLRAVVVPQ